MKELNWYRFNLRSGMYVIVTMFEDDSVAWPKAKAWFEAAHPDQYQSTIVDHGTGRVPIEIANSALQIKSLMEADPNTWRVETELSIRWCAANPELFAARYHEFFATYKDGWKITSKATAGYLTLIAERI